MNHESTGPHDYSDTTSCLEDLEGRVNSKSAVMGN